MGNEHDGKALLTSGYNTGKKPGNTAAQPGKLPHHETINPILCFFISMNRRHYFSSTPKITMLEKNCQIH